MSIIPIEVRVQIDYEEIIIKIPEDEFNYENEEEIKLTLNNHNVVLTYQNCSENEFDIFDKVSFVINDNEGEYHGMFYPYAKDFNYLYKDNIELIKDTEFRQRLFLYIYKIHNFISKKMWLCFYKWMKVRGNTDLVYGINTIYKDK